VSDISEDKAAARKAAFAARKAAHQAGIGAAEALRDHLMATRLLTGARVISAYRPIRTEIDPTPLMDRLHAAGHTLAVPVIEAPATPLSFAVWTPGAAMEVGAFGAEIPVDGARVTPDALLVPLLSFDRAGYRLGYGGGFYDRTLERLRARGRVRAIGLAYAAQEVPAVPRDVTDQRLDAIATERGILWPAADAA